MNIYEVDAGERDGYTDCYDGERRRDMPFSVQTNMFVGAPSRSQAWAQFRKFWYAEDIELDFLARKSIRLLYENVDCEAGVDDACDWLERHNYRREAQL